MPSFTCKIEVRVMGRFHSFNKCVLLFTTMIEQGEENLDEPDGWS